jgi:hypothetical protein
MAGNGFNRFPAGRNPKPLKRLDDPAPANTGLKPGANEKRHNTEMRPSPSPSQKNFANPHLAR